MDYKWLFYLITIADNAKILFLTIAIVSSIIGGITMLRYIGLFDEYNKETGLVLRKWSMIYIPVIILGWSLWVFTPSKLDALIIVGGGETLNFISRDSSAQKIPPTVLRLVETKLLDELKDVELMGLVKGKKEVILQEAKNMTGEELLKRMENDKEFSKIITGSD